MTMTTTPLQQHTTAATAAAATEILPVTSHLFIFVPTTEIFSKAVVAVATPIALTTTTKLGSMSFKFKIYCTLSCITLTRNKTNSKPSSAVATTIATTIAVPVVVAIETRVR